MIDMVHKDYKTAACIGGGVIGGGWVARFLLHGWDVNVYDPAADAQRKLDAVLDNARAALPQLADVTMPTEGTLTFCESLETAVTNADWIQESVPERLDIKHKVFAQVQAACAKKAIIGSSTSGFKPSQLQENALRPQQIMVAHPFNPVYLLPLVELVPSPANGLGIIEQAQDLLRSVGLYPLRVRKEIDAHIADRFLEAVWREGLVDDQRWHCYNHRDRRCHSLWLWVALGTNGSCLKPIVLLVVKRVWRILLRNLDLV